MLRDTSNRCSREAEVRSSLSAGSAICMNICGWLASIVSSFPVHAYGTTASGPSSLPMTTRSVPPSSTCATWLTLIQAPWPS